MINKSLRTFRDVRDVAADPQFRSELKFLHLCRSATEEQATSQSNKGEMSTTTGSWREGLRRRQGPAWQEQQRLWRCANCWISQPNCLDGMRVLLSVLRSAGHCRRKHEVKRWRPLFPWAWTILDFILVAFKPRRQGKVGQRSSPP